MLKSIYIRIHISSTVLELMCIGYLALIPLTMGMNNVGKMGVRVHLQKLFLRYCIAVGFYLMPNSDV